MLSSCRSAPQQGRAAHWPRDGPGTGQTVREHTHLYQQAHTVYCTVLHLFSLFLYTSCFLCFLFSSPLLRSLLYIFFCCFRIAQISVSPGSNSSGSAVGGLKEVQRKASPRRNIHHRRKMEVESDGSTEETDSSENWPLTIYHSSSPEHTVAVLYIWKLLVVEMCTSVITPPRDRVHHLLFLQHWRPEKQWGTDWNDNQNTYEWRTALRITIVPSMLSGLDKVPQHATALRLLYVCIWCCS